MLLAMALATAPAAPAVVDAWAVYVLERSATRDDDPDVVRHWTIPLDAAARRRAFPAAQSEWKYARFTCRNVDARGRLTGCVDDEPANGTGAPARRILPMLTVAPTTARRIAPATRWITVAIRFQFGETEDSGDCASYGFCTTTPPPPPPPPPPARRGEAG
jgi:hypothetical protein